MEGGGGGVSFLAWLSSKDRAELLPCDVVGAMATECAACPGKAHW